MSLIKPNVSWDRFVFCTIKAIPTQSRNSVTGVAIANGRNLLSVIFMQHTCYVLCAMCHVSCVMCLVLDFGLLFFDLNFELG